MSDQAGVSFSAERWREVFAAADHALDLSPAERETFIKQCSTDDPVLGAELEALLGSADSASALDGSAATFAGPMLGDLPLELIDVGPPSRIGPYRILEAIGRGGMGAVYVAERADDQYRKRVALKLLHRWSAGDEHRVRRFVEERQILAALEHPDIARLLDGGVTPDGLPWFAMEYVEGVPIDRHCEEHRVPIEHRLEIFCRVCAAVQYAHRNLVVHRDLKPANILVSADGAVKLLDFGIAKLLGGEITSTSAVLTFTGERVMTPLYASPEQVRGEPVSTASDVYALGVLLYKLLVGCHPYRLSSWQPHEVARAILEQEPERPSASVLRAPDSDWPGAMPEHVAAERGTGSAKLRRQLRGDLDAIALKAMEKDPRRRYGSVEQLEADVRRHLSGLPVTARPPSRIYQATRFVRRHRIGAAVTAGGTLLVLGFTVVTAVQSVRIRAYAERIVLERQRATGVSRYLIELVQTGTPSSADRVVTLREILDSATARIEQQATGRPEQSAEPMFEMARWYHRLGLHDKARSLVEASLALQRSIQPTRDRDVAESLHLLGAIFLAQGQLAPAEKSYAEALTLRRRELGSRHGDVARTLVGLASVRRTQRRLSEAESLAREAMAIDESLQGDVAADLAESASTLARVLLDKGDHRGAERLFRRALAIQRGTHGEEHADVARSVLDLAAALNRAGEPNAADSLIRYGLELSQRLVTAAALSSRPDTVVPSMGQAPHEATAPIQRALAERPTPAASTAGGEVPDDSRIVYVSDRDGPDPTGNLGNQEIYVMNADGSDQRRLTRHGAMDEEPAWSPDGKKIAFSSLRDGRSAIFVMNADGTGERRLTNPAEPRGANEPTWSPDGKRIAFHGQGDRSDIYVINVDGTGLTNITHAPPGGAVPAWSPDGRRIAFNSRRDGNPEIYLMDSDGRNVDRLTFNAATDRAPAWSPDGRKIAFHSDRDGDQEIYVMNADGSAPVRLTSSPGEDGQPSWSPDGRRIAFHRRVLGHLQIHVMNADGSEPRRLTELSPVIANGFPRWSPARR